MFSGLKLDWDVPKPRFDRDDRIISGAMSWPPRSRKYSGRNDLIDGGIINERPTRLIMEKVGFTCPYS